jgi:single-strand DNA-binding protein
MNSFTLFAVGNLAAQPQPGKKGDRTYTRFRLIGNDYGGKDDNGRPVEVTTSMWFVAFGRTGEAIAQHCRIGDQLIVNARVRNTKWTDQQGNERYGHSFQVEGFSFGSPGRLSRGEQSESGPQKESTERSEDLDDIPF